MILSEQCGNCDPIDEFKRNQCIESNNILTNLKNLQFEDINDNNLLMIKALLSDYIRKYSKISLERILNFHYNTCIEEFSRSHEDPILLRHSEIVLTAFCDKYKLTTFLSLNFVSIEESSNILNSLVKKLLWNIEELSDSILNLFKDPSMVDEQILLPQSKSNESILEIYKNCYENQLKIYYKNQPYKILEGQRCIGEKLRYFQLFLSEEEIERIRIVHGLAWNAFFIILNSHNQNNPHDFNLLKESLKFKNNSKSQRQIEDIETIYLNIINGISENLYSLKRPTGEIVKFLKIFIIKLRDLDSTGFLVEQLMIRGRIYLKQRRDLNEVLLNFLLSDESKASDDAFDTDNTIRKKSYDLILLNQKKATGAGGSTQFTFALDCEDLLDQSDWSPDPFFVKDPISSTSKYSDPSLLLICSLSTPAVLSELYQKRLSKKLCNIGNTEEIEEIIGQVERVKRRFGDSFITSVGVMINDVLESRVKNLNVDFFHVMTISHRYWPDHDHDHDRNQQHKHEDEHLKHPEFISEKFRSISTSFQKHTTEKLIKWRPHRDEVVIELEFESVKDFQKQPDMHDDCNYYDSTIKVQFVCPPEAAIMMNSFSFPDDSEEEFNISMLTALTGLNNPDLLASAIKFWIKKRVLLVSFNTEDVASASSAATFKFAREYDPEESDCIDTHLLTFSKVSFVDDEEGEEEGEEVLALQKYWSIITNMFKTFGQISAERIHSTLSMYSKEYKGSPIQLLIKFLQLKVKEGTLHTTGNKIILYSLK